MNGFKSFLCVLFLSVPLYAQTNYQPPKSPAEQIAAFETLRSEQSITDDYEYLTIDEKAIWAGHNLSRVRRKQPIVKVSKQIVDECREWAEHLRTQNRLYHACNIENCVRGYDGKHDVPGSWGIASLRAWFSSSGHNAFLHRSNNEVGGVGLIGIEDGYTYGVYRAAASLEDYEAKVNNSVAVQKPQSAYTKQRSMPKWQRNLKKLFRR